MVGGDGSLITDRSSDKTSSGSEYLSGVRLDRFLRQLLASNNTQSLSRLFLKLSQTTGQLVSHKNTLL